VTSGAPFGNDNAGGNSYHKFPYKYNNNITGSRGAPFGTDNNIVNKKYNSITNERVE